MALLVACFSARAGRYHAEQLIEILAVLVCISANQSATLGVYVIEDLTSKLEIAGLSEHAGAIRELARPSVRIEARRCNQDALTIGACLHLLTSAAHGEIDGIKSLDDLDVPAFRVVTSSSEKSRNGPLPIRSMKALGNGV